MNKKKTLVQACMSLVAVVMVILAMQVTTRAAQTVTVKFNANGGSVTPTSKVYEVGKRYGTLPTPTKTGYIFSGWYNPSGNKVTTDSYVMLDPITLTAHWTADTYTITFVQNTGAPDIKKTGTYGKALSTIAPSLSKSNYTFAGWYTSNSYTTKVPTSTIITGARTLYAKWVKNTYTITYVQNNGAPDIKKTGTHGDTFSTINPTVKKLGYTFAGWYTSNDYTTKVADSTTITGAKTLYAKWVVQTFKVLFVQNNGSIDISKNVSYGTVLSTVQPSVSRRGYTFGGWYSDSGYQNKVDSSTTVTADMTLYAKWTPNTYTITYVPYTGAPDIKKSGVYDNTYASINPALSRVGYTFGGWYTESSFTNEVAPSARITGDITLYAKWIVHTYKLLFVQNNGSIDISKNVSYGTVLSTVQPSVSRRGYTFGGWYSDSSYQNKVDSSTTVTADMTLYAKWTINTYTVTYVLNTGAPDLKKNAVFGTRYATVNPTLSQTNYDFGGWYSESSYINKIDPDDVITGNITLYAKWTPNRYTIVFVPNNGEESQSFLGDYGSLISTVKPVIKNPGYKLEGYYLENSFNTKINTTTTNITGDIRLYANWEAREFQIIFYPHNGELPLIRKGLFGELISSVKPVFKKKGYTLSGYYKESEYVNKVNTTTTKISGNLKLHAKWTPRTYTITCIPNNGKSTIYLNGSYDSLLYKILPSDVVGSETLVTKYGETLVGWYYDEAFTRKVGKEDLINGHTTLYARWTPTKCKITFVQQNGSPDINKTVDYGVFLTNYVPTVSRSGYIFDGWYRDSACTKRVVPGNELIIKDVSFFAKWKPYDYTITFKQNNGQADVTKGATADMTYGDIWVNPTMSGVTFLGWCTDKACTKYVYKDTKITGSRTLYAKWGSGTIISSTAKRVDVMRFKMDGSIGDYSTQAEYDVLKQCTFNDGEEAFFAFPLDVKEPFTAYAKTPNNRLMFRVYAQNSEGKTMLTTSWAHSVSVKELDPTYKYRVEIKCERARDACTDRFSEGTVRIELLSGGAGFSQKYSISNPITHSVSYGDRVIEQTLSALPKLGNSVEAFFHHDYKTSTWRTYRVGEIYYLLKTKEMPAYSEATHHYAENYYSTVYVVQRKNDTYFFQIFSTDFSIDLFDSWSDNIKGTFTEFSNGEYVYFTMGISLVKSLIGDQLGQLIKGAGDAGAIAQGMWDVYEKCDEAEEFLTTSKDIADLIKANGEVYENQERLFALLNKQDSKFAERLGEVIGQGHYSGEANMLDRNLGSIVDSLSILGELYVAVNENMDITGSRDLAIKKVAESILASDVSNYTSVKQVIHDMNIKLGFIKK